MSVTPGAAGLTRSTAADLPEVDAVVVGAMDEEVSPYARRAREAGRTAGRGQAELQHLTVAGARILLVRSGIGLVNAAAAATAALSVCRPRAILSTGSAGGLGAEVQVGDVVVGDRYTYTGADATAFDYALGQVPGMPITYAANPGLLSAARSLTTSGGTLRVGQMVSGDAFVTAGNVTQVREAFPHALTTDMETTALAQVAYSYGVPFLSVRAVSDLCGPVEDHREQVADFQLGLTGAAERSADLLLALLGR